LLSTGFNIFLSMAEARLIQAHIAPVEQRIKLRYSQLFDFDYCPREETLDLFTRWLLSEPLSPDAAFSEEGETPEPPRTTDFEISLPVTLAC
jgi:hypothetical protein